MGLTLTNLDFLLTFAAGSQRDRQMARQGWVASRALLKIWTSRRDSSVNSTADWLLARTSGAWVFSFSAEP